MASLGQLSQKYKDVKFEFEVTSIEFEKDTINFQVKSAVSAADHEFMSFNGINNKESAYLARRIHRLVRDEDGTQIDLNVCEKMPFELLWQINLKIAKVHGIDLDNIDENDENKEEVAKKK